MKGVCKHYTGISIMIATCDEIAQQCMHSVQMEANRMWVVFIHDFSLLSLK